MSVLDEMKGQLLAQKILSAVLRTGRIATTYLFAGPRGTGKKQAGILFAEVLNCEKEGCGACQTCMLIRDGAHPDVKMITALQDKKEIILDQMRNVQAEAYLRSFSGRYKVYIIEDAENMTEEAANSLLKVLEEPPEHTVFILITSRPQMILPTISSRCQKVRFVREAAELSEEALEKGFSLVPLLGAGKTEMLQGISGITGGRDGSIQAIEGLLAWYRDVLFRKEGLEAVSYKDREKELVEFGRRFTPDSLVRIIERILHAREQVARNVNPQLSTEMLMLELNNLYAAAHGT